MKEHLRSIRGQGDGLPYVEDFHLLGYRFKRNGKCETGVERTLKRAMFFFFFHSSAHLIRKSL